MNFWDCMPEYCLTKKVTATKSGLIEVKSNISVSGATPVTIYSFVPAVSGRLYVSVYYEANRRASMQVLDNGTSIIGPISSNENFGTEISITRGHRYDIKVVYNDGSAGTVPHVFIGGVISDDFSTLFISDITE